MKDKRIYIAGPMSGFPNCNREAFNEASNVLQGKGCIVLNPATLPAGLTKIGGKPLTSVRGWIAIIAKQ